MSARQLIWCLLGTVLAAACAFVLGIQVGGQAVREHHRDAVFREQVDKHGCRPTAIYWNGKRLVGSTCVLPDGTILER